MTDRIKHAFDAVRAEQPLKARTKEYLNTAMQKRESKRSAPIRFAQASAACLAVIIIITGGTLVFTPVSAITVEVNPAIELGVNRFDMVVSVAAANDDGFALSNSYNLKYMNYADAVEEIVKSDELSRYVENGEQISITVLGFDDDKGIQMLSCLNSRSGLNSGYIHCYAGNREQAQSAREAGLTLGKYKAFLELQALDPNAKPEDVQGLTMREIRDMIYEASGETVKPYAGNGKGYGRGRGAARGNGRQSGY